MSSAGTITVEVRLNGRARTIDVGPAERLLDLLRYRLDLPGSKEGCAEGECGACTVYLDGLPVDSCLVPAYQIDGREVETIESIDPEGLDPFLLSGATQCGACTPGVVMTATWIRDHPDLVETHPVRELMAGNLCRCTGYDGIVEGVEGALGGTKAVAPRTATDEPTAAAPPTDHPDDTVASPDRAGVFGAGEVFAPGSIEEALEVLAERPDAVPVAGATDLYVHWPALIDRHDIAYLDLGGIGDLRSHHWTDDALVLGGSTTYWDVIGDRRATAELPLLADAGRQVGAIQIQARGTWAGNIVNASPAADGVPVLMTYDSAVTLRSAGGERTVPLDRFYSGYKEMDLRPGELITAITIPRRAYRVQWFDKVGSRAAQAITKVGVAVTCTEAGDWRVVANSVAPTVTRCAAVERLLATTGEPDLATVQAAVGEDVRPIDDIRSTAEYRERVLARLIHFGLARERGVNA